MQPRHGVLPVKLVPPVKPIGGRVQVQRYRDLTRLWKPFPEYVAVYVGASGFGKLAHLTGVSTGVSGAPP